MSVSFDLQSGLQVPSMEVSFTYCMRNLYMYNFTIYVKMGHPIEDSVTYGQKSEATGGRGCEIGTCLLKYIENLSENIKTI